MPARPRRAKSAGGSLAASLSAITKIANDEELASVFEMMRENLARKRPPTKIKRQEKVHKYRTETDMDFPQILQAIYAERPELVLKGKGKKVQLIKVSTLKKEYAKWLKGQR